MVKKIFDKNSKCWILNTLIIFAFTLVMLSLSNYIGLRSVGREHFFEITDFILFSLLIALVICIFGYLGCRKISICMMVCNLLGLIMVMQFYIITPFSGSLVFAARIVHLLFLLSALIFGVFIEVYDRLILKKLRV